MIMRPGAEYCMQSSRTGAGNGIQIHDQAGHQHANQFLLSSLDLSVDEEQYCSLVGLVCRGKPGYDCSANHGVH